MEIKVNVGGEVRLGLTDELRGFLQQIIQGLSLPQTEMKPSTPMGATEKPQESAKPAEAKTDKDKTEKSAEKPTEAEKKAEPKKEEAKTETITLDAIRKLIGTNKNKAKAILEQMGAGKLSDLDQAKRAEFVETWTSTDDCPF